MEVSIGELSEALSSINEASREAVSSMRKLLIAMCGYMVLTKRQHWLSIHGKDRVRKKWLNVAVRKLDKYKKQLRGAI